MKTLFDHVNINNIELKNRLVRSATWERMADENGYVNDRLVKVYQDLAQGGVGLIITGYAFVTAAEQPNPRMIGVCDDSYIEGLQRLTEVVHNNDSKIVLQIAYGGSQTRYQTENRVIWGPSAVKHPRTGVVPIEMSQQQIDELIDWFAEAGVRAQKADFDGVQIHGAHGYLLSQFLSPYFNRRTDKYGGSLKNRMRIICEIYEEMRSRVGSDFSIMIKINCSDFTDNGFTFADAQVVCQRLAELGIDAIEVSGSKDPAAKPADQSIFAKYAAKIAEQVACPVIVVNKNRDPQLITNLLNNTDIAFFSFSRPLIREPDLPNRWKNADFGSAKCISCNKCFNEQGMKCIFLV